uniref:Uncharacterized protein n=1 Tax=Ixodes ricinus TaxID=34613 RepID=A0A6B0UYA0_IXORI
MRGRTFLLTTASCMSSRVGCWPTSSSKGSMYSSTGPSWAEQRDTSSQSTRAQAYMSMRRNASRLKLMAPSSTSGAMYRRVPTCPCASPGEVPQGKARARPKSAKQAVMSALSSTFLLLKSRWARAGLYGSSLLAGSSSCRCRRPRAIDSPIFSTSPQLTRWALR